MILSLLYLLLPLSCFGAAFIKEYKNSRIWQYSLISIIALFFCFGYMNGVDWKEYEMFYHSLCNGSDGLYYHMDFGYLWLNVLFINLGLSFWPFFILLRLFCFFSLIVLLSKFAGRNFWLCLGLFIGSDLIGIMIENAMRTTLSMAVFWLSCIAYCRLKNPTVFMIFLPIAISLHNSALALIPLLLLGAIFRRLRSLYVFFLFTGLFIAFSNQALFLDVLIYAGQFISDGRFVKYFSNPSGRFTAGQIFSVTNIVVLFVTGLFFFYRQKIERYSNFMPMLLSFSLIWVLAYRMSTTVPIFTRIAFYFLPFFQITAVTLFKNIIKSNIAKICLIAMIVHSLIVTYMLITSNHKYVPYSNYLFYALQGEDLSYSYRCEYNIKNSPFKSKDYTPPKSLVLGLIEGL